MSDLEFQTGWERYRLPVLLAGGLALYGAARFDATRPIAGLLLTYGFPLLAIGFGVAKMRGTAMFGPALAVGSVAAGAAELAIGHARAPEVELFAAVPPNALIVAALVSALAAPLVQALASSRGIRNYFAAWVGMVTVLTLYMPTHARVGKDSLDAFVAALIVSLFVGGGLGMALGGLAGRVVKPREAPPRASLRNPSRPAKPDNSQAS